MRNSIKSKRLKSLMALALIMTACAVVGAADNSESSEKNQLPLPLQQRMQKRIYVDFRNMPIEDAIRIMAEQANVDIIKGPDVVGEVTATLSNAPLEEALKNILAAHGYGYVVTKNMIRVAPVAELNQKSARLVSRIYRITYADVAQVEKALQKFISGLGTLSSNPGTSNIIVTDSESKIEAIDAFIKEIDRVTPQILVEVRIYDVTNTSQFELGVDWEIGRRTTYTNIGTVGGVSGISDPHLTGKFSGVVNKAKDTTGLIRFGILNSHLDIDAIIRAEEQDACVKLLANPRILVLDNETAVFKIVREIPYVELSETSAGGSLTSVKFKEVGVYLRVTPHVTRDGMIRLHMVPEFGVEVGKEVIGVPQVDTRSADTKTLIGDGQTIVIGGLRKQDIRQQTNKVPFFGDLPVVGALFKSEGEETIISELIVFVTPRIIEQAVLSEREAAAFETTEICRPECAPTKVGPCRTNGEDKE